MEKSTDGTTFAFVANAPADATAYAVTGLSPNTTYTFRVRAFNAGGDSAWSNTAQATTPAGVAAGATYLGADATTQGSWEGAYGADGYTVRRGVRRPAGVRPGHPEREQHVHVGGHTPTPGPCSGPGRRTAWPPPGTRPPRLRWTSTWRTARRTGCPCTWWTGTARAGPSGWT